MRLRSRQTLQYMGTRKLRINQSFANYYLKSVMQAVLLLFATFPTHALP